MSQWKLLLKSKKYGSIYLSETSDLAVGFARGRLHDGAIAGFQCELNKIYVLRTSQRIGVGQALVSNVALRFLRDGLSGTPLFGDSSSEANGFYERLGAERLYSTEEEFHGGYGWRDLTTLTSVSEEHDPI